MPEALRARVTRAAGRAGKTAHAFVVEAIAEKVEQAERRDEFLALGDARSAEIARTGKAVPWKDMRAYLEARVSGRGRNVRRPVAKKLR
ncbi:MAG TPA: hypothetical protein VGL61_32945 [Kofleriaceae bacterium]